MTASDPRTFARFQENALRGTNRAFFFFLVGFVVASLGLALAQSVPTDWYIGDILAVAGLGIIFYGLSLSIRNILRRVKDTVEVSRALRTPDPAAPLPSPASGDASVGQVLLPPTPSRGTSSPSTFLRWFAALMGVGVVAFATDLILRPGDRSEQAIIYLVLLAVLVPCSRSSRTSNGRFPGSSPRPPRPQSISPSAAPRDRSTPSRRISTTEVRS